MPSDGDSFDFPSANRAISAIPEAWRELLQRRDAGLIDRVVTVVETRTGLRPDPAAVLRFLTELSSPAHLETQRTSESHPGIRGPSIFPSQRREG